MAFLKHSITELTLTARRNSSRYVGLLESLKRPRHGWPCACFSCSVQRLCCTVPLLHSSSPAARNRPAVYREPAKRFDEAPRSKVTLLISIWMNPPCWRASHRLFFFIPSIRQLFDSEWTSVRQIRQYENRFCFICLLSVHKHDHGLW